MKLKKLLALAMSGVLAVSMLAGCSTTSNNGGNGDNGNGGSDVTPTSSTASILRENLGGEARRNVTAVADNGLDTALKSAVADYCNDYTITTFVKSYSLNDIRAWDLGEAVIDDNEDSIADLKSIDGKDVTAVEVYAIDKSVSDNFILEMLAKKIDNYCADSYLPDMSSDKAYDYDYEISASIVSVDSNNSVVDQGVKFVAFSVTKLATEYV